MVKTGECCWNAMNKHFFLYLICMALITSCADLPDTPGPRTASATPPGTATPSVPTPEPATTAVVTPTPENYRLYTDSDLQIYADTLDVRIQEALKNNDSNQAQVLGLKRQELIAEFNRRGLKRHPTGPTPRSHVSHSVARRGSKNTHARTKVNPPGAGLPGEN
jgi:flagellar basal body L-ring protein FlgH